MLTFKNNNNYKPMFKLFKKGEEINQSSDSKSELEQEVITEEMSVEDKIDNQADNTSENQEIEFLVGLKDVKEYININGQIDPETLEMMTGLSLEDTFAKVEEMRPKVEIGSQELKEAIVASLAVLEEPKRENWLRKVANRPAVRAIFVTLMLLLKFAPDAKGEEKASPDLNQKIKTESSNEKSSSIDDPNTYLLSEAELAKMQLEDGDAKELSIELQNLERFSQLKLNNYYETDLDVIPESNQAEIKDKFVQFLDQINADNVDQVLASEFKIFGSSDERPTNNWDGSNENLTQARIAAAEKLLQGVLAEYDFSDRLSAEQIAELQAKSFKAEMPAGGVTHLVDLINPQTGENYSEEEVANFSESERLELLKECRRIDVDFLAKKEVKIHELKPMAAEIEQLRLDNLDKTLTNWKNYQQVALIVDKSPSMNNSYQLISEIISNQEALQDTKLHYATFSDKLDKLENLSQLSEVEEKIKTMVKDGSHQERAVESALSALKQIRPEVGAKMKLIVATDEELQRLDYEKLSQLQAEAALKNCEVDFIYAHNRLGGAAQIVSLEELTNNYTQIAWEKFSPLAKIVINHEGEKLIDQEASLKRLQNVADRMLARKDLKKKDLKQADEYQVRINTLTAQISQSKLLLNNLQNSLENGDIEQLELAVKSTGTKYRVPVINIIPDNMGVNIDLSQKI